MAQERRTRGIQDADRAFDAVTHRTLAIIALGAMLAVAAIKMLA